MSSAQTSLPCSVIRGGTSKGLYFLAHNLPSSVEDRDRVLLAAMGSPDSREIDGMGGGHPLTSKVAIVSKSQRSGVDVDYLFLQVWPDRAEVSDQQNCGNILAGVAPFAIEEGLVSANDGHTEVSIYMVNTNSTATALVETPGGVVKYEGSATIDGVPGSHAPITINFDDVVGSSCGELLPTGNVIDLVQIAESTNPFRATCIDNGMPVVCLDANEFGITGYESPAELEANESLKTKVEAVRLAVGPLMNLGDVTSKTVPKMCLISRAQHGGLVNTRTFIPARVHDSIGVLGAVSVATACVLPGTVAAAIAGNSQSTSAHSPVSTDESVTVEHPTGSFTVQMELAEESGAVTIKKSALIRTARLLMRGEVFVPSSVWSN